MKATILAVLLLVSLLAVTGQYQICSSSKKCGEGGCCARNGRFGICSNGTGGEFCGDPVNNCPCVEGQCQGNICQVRPSTTTTTTTAAPGTNGASVSIQIG